MSVLRPLLLCLSRVSLILCLNRQQSAFELIASTPMDGPEFQDEYPQFRTARLSPAAGVAVMWTLAILSQSLPAGEHVAKPNVVFILADDLGFSDTTLFGTTKLYRTPNIERLAARGMTFTHAYAVSPLCSPTRSGILTGLHPARTGLTSPNCHLPQVTLTATPGGKSSPNVKAAPVNSVSRLDTRYYTLSEALHDAGYRTGHFGKWHLGHEPYSPLEHGFDVDVPHWPGPGPAGSYVAPWRFPDFDPDTPKQHIEDRMAKEAVQFMKSAGDQPFFLNYWMFSVHAPFDAKQSLIDRYRKQVDPTSAQRSPTYAAMIESMDDAVGTLLDTLDALKISDRTIIVFASDNGGNMYNEVDGTTPTSNSPLRGGKATMYEGGVRGPCVVVWPGVADGRAVSPEVVQSCDFYPSLLEMLAIEPQAEQIFDGISIVPALQGESLDRDTVFTYFPHAPRVPDWLPPAVSVHAGDWKLIRIFHGGEDGAHRWKLFNLRKDVGEEDDLAKQQPDRVKQLDALIENFLVETQAVVPARNPGFDPSKYRLEDEGVSRRNEPRKKPNEKSKPVAGWHVGNFCRLKVDGDELLITSTGNDPHLSCRMPKPVPAGQLTVVMTMASNAKGRGQVFWQEQGVTPAFFRDHSVNFDMQHNDKPHQYTVSFEPEHSVIAVRLDPGQAKGEIRLSEFRVTDADGKEVYRCQIPKSSKP